MAARLAGRAGTRDAGLWVRTRLSHRARGALAEQSAEHERERLRQFLSAIEHRRTRDVLDAGDQIEWCNSLAADHFGLDPQRDRRQR